MKKKLALSLLILGLLTAFYFAGPRPAPLELNNKWPSLDLALEEISPYLANRESQFQLRHDNEAQIIWADSVRKTEWTILYLHGFSASQGEGAPVHRRIAKEIGANLILARLAGHGYLHNQLEDFKATAAWEDAKEYLSLAQLCGEKVILMGTSTGCSYALNLAAQFPDKVEAILNLSANIRVNDPAAFLLNDPWGKEIAEMVIGPYRRVVSDSIGHALYWDTLYTVNALVELEHLLESTLHEETFAKVQEPTLNLCYYKSETEQDPVVRVNKIEWMHQALATPEDQKRLVKLDRVGNHVLASPIKSRDVAQTENAIRDFLREILMIEI
jgi:pimeloyl-ACP methyl ester carboxylesterase